MRSLEKLSEDLTVNNATIVSRVNHPPTFLSAQLSPT